MVSKVSRLSVVCDFYSVLILCLKHLDNMVAKASTVWLLESMHCDVYSVLTLWPVVPGQFGQCLKRISEMLQDPPKFEAFLQDAT
jgi:hypothetical protein